MNNDLRRIVFFLIFLFFFVRFFVIPAIQIIVNVVRLARLKHQIGQFGPEIVRVKDKKKTGKSFYIYHSVMILIIILYSLLTKEPLLLLLNLFFVPQLLDTILLEKYSKYNGFYENGIVKGQFFEWKDIFSWKKIDEDKLSILKQDGLRFDIETASQQGKVIDFLISKGIQTEK